MNRLVGRRQSGPLWRTGRIFLLALFAWTGTAWSAPNTFNTALPVGEGEFVFREQFVFDQSGDDPSGADKDRTAWAFVSVLGYGVNSDLALFGVVPYVNKRLELTDNGDRRTRNADGLGDISLFGRYTVLKRNWPQRSFRVAPFAGIEVPTGDDDESDAFGRQFLLRPMTIGRLAREGVKG